MINYDILDYIVNKINECNRDIESVVKTLQYLVNNYDKIANFSEKYSVEIEGFEPGRADGPDEDEAGQLRKDFRNHD